MFSLSCEKDKRKFSEIEKNLRTSFDLCLASSVNFLMQKLSILLQGMNFSQKNYEQSTVTNHKMFFFLQLWWASNVTFTLFGEEQKETGNSMLLFVKLMVLFKVEDDDRAQL